MFLDLHTHSVSSDDARATVEQYAKWVAVLRGRGFQLDGFVLTEHRKFDLEADYTALARESDVLILKGSELDTDRGHFLVYGVTEELLRRVDFAHVGLGASELVAAAGDCGAIAIPAHPGRFGIGLYEYQADRAVFDGLEAAELLNGSNRTGEQERAEELIRSHALRGTGGSDAHVVSAIGTCMTHFDGPIADEADLVRELRLGTFHAVKLEETKQTPLP